MTSLLPGTRQPPRRAVAADQVCVTVSGERPHRCSARRAPRSLPGLAAMHMAAVSRSGTVTAAPVHASTYRLFHGSLSGTGRRERARAGPRIGRVTPPQRYHSRRSPCKVGQARQQVTRARDQERRERQRLRSYSEAGYVTSAPPGNYGPSG